METEQEELEKIICNPVTPRHWRNFETLFGQNGADGGCWCMQNIGLPVHLPI